MFRGDIYLCDFDPARGSEATKTRPCVIVSNNGANIRANMQSSAVVTVVPITSNTARVFSFQTFLPAAETGLHRDSKAQAELVRSVAASRLGTRIGKVSTHLMTQIDEALRVHLNL